MIKVMVVDDEKPICDFVRSFFGERGHQVISVTDPAKAISLVEQEKPQIIILDIRMPQISGLTLLEQIRKIDKEAKIIMVTIVDDIETQKKAKELGADAFISKPFNTEYLEEVVMAKIQELYPLKKKEEK